MHGTVCKTEDILTSTYILYERTKGSLALCLVASWSPGGFVGDPTSLARDNINVGLRMSSFLH